MTLASGVSGRGFKSRRARHHLGSEPTPNQPRFKYSDAKPCMNPRRKPSHIHLLEDAEVRRWYENVRRGSRITADVYLRRLGGLCMRKNTTPAALARLGDRDATRLLLDHVSRLEAEGYAGSYIESIVKAARSWLSHNRTALTVKIKITGTEDTPTLLNERTPTSQELAGILRAGELDARAAAALIAFSGVRPISIGNYDGSDGIRVGDFLEVNIDRGEKKVEFEKIPALVRVRKCISKARHQYLTLLCEEGCRYLADYWEYRMRLGETFTSDSAAIRARFASKQFIRTTNVGDKIRNAIRVAGFTWRPYVLRSYFDTQLMLAESKGLVMRDYRVFWMGHKGDIEHRYTTNKHRLPEPVIEDMRQSYRRAQKYLQTQEPTGESDLRLEFRRQLLLVVGYSKKEVEEMKLEELGDDELQTRLKERLLKKNGNNHLSSNGGQKVIAVDDVEEYIESGWEYVAQLPKGKAIVKQPLTPRV